MIDLINYVDPVAIGDFITVLQSLPDDEPTPVFLGGKYLGSFVGPKGQWLGDPEDCEDDE